MLDVFIRLCVGRARGTHMRIQLILSALNMAICQRRPIRVVASLRPGKPIHLDRVRSGLHEAGIAASTGLVGDCYNNALTEGFFATFHANLSRGTPTGREPKR